MTALAAVVNNAGSAADARPGADPLDNVNRRRLYEYILAEPGATLREVLRGTAICAGTARYHLAVLRKWDFIKEMEHKGTLRYFENHERFAEAWPAIVALREPEMRNLHEWLVANPGRRQRAIIDAAGHWGWRRTTTQHRLKRLAADGLVAVAWRGRLRTFTARPAPPAAHPTVPAMPATPGTIQTGTPAPLVLAAAAWAPSAWVA